MVRSGFKRHPRHLDQFGGCAQLTTNAIVWALVESDPDNTEKLDLSKEIAALKTEALDANSAGGKIRISWHSLQTCCCSVTTAKPLTSCWTLKEKQKGGTVTGAQTRHHAVRRARSGNRNDRARVAWLDACE